MADTITFGGPRPSIGYTIRSPRTAGRYTPTRPGVSHMALGTFSAAVNAFAAKTPKQVNQIVRRAVLELFSRIVYRTPVDTGRARGGWQAGFNPTMSSPIRTRGGSRGIKYQTPHGPLKVKVPTMSRFIGGEVDKKGGKTVARASGFINTINADRDGVIAYIWNNVHYIIYLEYGHSQQAPTGMVRVTLAAWTAIVNGAASAWGTNR